MKEKNAEKNDVNTRIKGNVKDKENKNKYQLNV